jgi:hypothetical protein
MNTERAKKMDVGHMILSVSDSGEGSYVAGLGYVSDQEKVSLARQVSLRLKKALSVGIMALSLFVAIPCYASIDDQIPSLVKTITLAESSGNPRAVGDGGESRGLMQIKEGTWRRHTTEPWSRAFEPALNVEIGTKELRRIIAAYRARGVEPSAAYVIWAYNTGSLVKRSLPRLNKQGQPHPWTWNHPNLVYRAIYREYLK